MRLKSYRSPIASFWIALGGGVVFSLAGCLVTQAPAPERAPASQDAPAINGGLSITAPADTTPQPAIRPLSPAEAQGRFYLPPGYRIEPVLTEPHIAEPAAIAFDGDGRMFVLELRTYMQDADATDELLPASRISMHEDRDNDGVYERHTVFVDSLIFPRFVMPFGAGSVLTMESNEDDVFKYTDTDGDGRADERSLFTTNFGRSGNVEHQQSFLYWAMDNWLYSTYNAFRVRWTPGGVIREPTGSNRAQWGVTQDNEGKVWFQGGASGLPSYFQFPIVYGNYDVEGQFEPGFEVPWGLAGLGDFQPGPGASRPDGTLNQVTGSAGNDVFRGHRLPADLIGDYLYGEPVARIVRRVRPVVTEGLTQLRNVYQPERSEFIRSTDPLFRPVDIATAPDGTLYVVDMYRGIIQEGNWTRRGTHLRAKIDQYELDEVHSLGRIWRVTYEGMERDGQQPRMLGEPPAQLVRHLAHPNGWWRDAAQQLLVLKQDKSVVPALKAMARDAAHPLARYHAVWTLEGLGALDAALARELMADADPKVRIQAIRASETLYKAGDRSLGEDYRRLALDPDTDVVIQAMMTLNTLKVPEAADAVQAAVAANGARGVQAVGHQILNPPDAGRGSRFTEAQQALLERGATIYDELCAQCHGNTGTGTLLGDGSMIAPALAGSPRVQGHRDYVVKTLLHGLSGPIEGAHYAGGLMLPMGENSDEWVASVASFIRNSFSNEASFVEASDVARVRAATAGRSEPYTYEELLATLPPLMKTHASWNATASHGAPAASGAFNFVGWSSGAPQEPGMWFQVELAEPVYVTELQFESPPRYVFAPRDAQGQRPPPTVQATYPRAYEVKVSLDGVTWSAPVAGGEGVGVTTIVFFEPVQARFVRILQTGRAEDGAPWSMQQLRIYTRPEAPPTPLKGNGRD